MPGAPGEVVVGEVGSDRPEVLWRRRRGREREAADVALWAWRCPPPVWRDRAPATIRVAAIGESVFTVTPGGAARPICHVSAATARFAASGYVPVGRQPDPEVTPRIRP